jgi:Domain of unknown function (DUF4383)
MAAAVHFREVDPIMGLARTVAAVFGAVYLLVGIVGFVLETPLLGLFEVNALHNIVHILLGAILLYGAMSTPVAIQATRGVGIVLIVLGILGFFSPDGFGLVPLGGNDIWLHLASGAILAVTGFMAPEEAAVA